MRGRGTVKKVERMIMWDLLEFLYGLESGDPVSCKKRRRGPGRGRSPDLDTSAGKRRRMGPGSRKGSAPNSGTTGGGAHDGSDSEENSDPLSTRQQLMGRRSPKPCQFNFLVQLGEWEYLIVSFINCFTWKC